MKNRGETLWAGPLATLIILVFLITPLTARDDDNQRFDYDLFVERDSLLLWFDVTPVLTQSILEDLLAGLDIYISLEINLERPRAILGNQTIWSRRSYFIIRRQITEDKYYLFYDNPLDKMKKFEYLMALQDHLADSLVIRLVSATRIKSEKKLQMSTVVKVKSIDNSGIGEEEEPRKFNSDKPDESRGWFDDLFNSFVELFGFGEKIYRIKSPSFNFSDLTERPL